MRVQQSDSAGVAILRSAMHGGAAERVGSRYVGASFNEEENNFVVAVLSSRLQRRDSVVFYPHLVRVLARV